MPHHILTGPIAESPPRETRREAALAGIRGWNLRCNRCGLWGALWYADQRPGWGALALCGPHAAELRQELQRHLLVLRVLREVRFEQPLPRTTTWSHA
jgi:hypothetical protein